MTLAGDRTLPPAPWANVIANPAAGFVRDRERRRVHLGTQQPLLPADAVEQ